MIKEHICGGEFKLLNDKLPTRLCVECGKQYNFIEEERQHCKYCEHELCPTCNECHNIDDNLYFTRPLEKCFDILKKMEHKHDLINLNADTGNGFGKMGEDVWSCKVCNQIITEPCNTKDKFCDRIELSCFLKRVVRISTNIKHYG